MGEALTLAVSAVLLAGFYAAMAYGLGLIYGVLGIVNVAHGGILMAAAYLAWQLFTRFHVDPYLSLPVAVFGISLVALLALHLCLTRTYWGKAIRAVVQNSESCTLVGIDVERVYTLSFGLGTALAGLAGVLASTLFAFT